MQVITGHGGFYLGLEAHDWGRPVENLADDRFLGAPETVALLYGGMTAYARQYDLALESIRAIVGLAQSSFAEDTIGDVVSGVRGWLVGAHAWQVKNVGKGRPRPGSPRPVRQERGRHLAGRRNDVRLLFG